MSSIPDPGDPISYVLLATGTPVYSSDEVRLATVRHVLAAEAEDIFDGIVVGDLVHSVMGSDGDHRFVDAPEVARLYERAVILTIDAATCRDLPAPTRNAGALATDPASRPPSGLGGKLHRAWDLLSGDY